MSNEIWVIPFFGQGHLFPCTELCKHLASRNYKITLFISSHVSSSLPSSLRQYPLIEVTEVPSSSPPPPPQPGSDPIHHNHHGMHNNPIAQSLEELLSTRPDIPHSGRPVCAIIDVMMSGTKYVFKRFNVPTISFFTSGACSAAMEYAMWKAHLVDIDIKPGEIHLLPGLPDEIGLTESDLKRRPHEPPGGGGGPLAPMGTFPGPPPMGAFPGPPPMGAFPGPPGEPPKPGEQPPWMEDVEGSIALMINTCDDLERPFIDYLANQIGISVWGVGPLLPDQFWKSVGSLLHDREIRSNRRSNVTEDEVTEWLDLKPGGSVLYVSFGSEVGPTIQELTQLADALEESNRPFIWVIQAGSGRPGPPHHPGSDGPEAEDEGYFPHGLDKRVGERGMIIRGWAPQLLILSHPSTGGFLSHCGWNSTVEAIGLGVPLLAWPIRGDQPNNAKLVVNHHKVGCMISDDLSEMIKKDDIIKGIERVMGNEDLQKRAQMLRAKFEKGFPASSVAAFENFISQNISFM